MSPSAVAPRSRRVLLIVDAQVNMLDDPPKGVPAAPIVKANIIRVLHAARTASLPPSIVHIRNCGDAGEPDQPHTPGWELAYQPAPGELVIDKLKNNAFAQTRLGEFVATDAEIVVVGMQSDYCIRATCSAALARGNGVILIRGAHATYDRQEVWAGGGITPASTIEKETEAELEEAGVVLLDMTDIPGVFADRDSLVGGSG